MNNFIEESKKRFRDNFCATHHLPKCDCHNREIEYLEQELKAQLEEIKQRLEGMEEESEIPDHLMEPYEQTRMSAYNQALQDIIETL